MTIRSRAHALIAILIFSILLCAWHLLSDGAQHRLFESGHAPARNLSRAPAPTTAAPPGIPEESAPAVQIEVKHPPGELDNIVSSFINFAQAWEKQRIIKRAYFAKYPEVGIKRLCIVIQSPGPEELKILGEETTNQLQLVAKSRLNDEDKRRVSDSIKQQYSFFSNFSGRYRIVEVAPYYSSKSGAWSFFYTSLDCDEVISQVDQDGNDNGFAGSRDEFPSRESGDRQYMEGRYSYLIAPNEFESLVPENDQSARDFLIELRADIERKREQSH